MSQGMGIGMSISYYVTRDGYRYEYLVIGIGMSISYYVTRDGYRYEYLVLCHKGWV